jgi:hypothetical protein
MRGILEQVGIAGVGLAYQSPATGRLVSIDGHMRKTLGDVPWPTAILDVTDAEAELLLLSHDPLGALAEALGPQLQRLLDRPSVATPHPALMTMFEGLAVQHKLLPATGRGGAAGDPVPAEDFDTTPMGGPGSNIHMVQLFLLEETYPAFKQACDTLAEVYGVETLTDTVVTCIQAAAAALEA